jgi:DNA-binding MarR family transcriptional regulator
MGKKRADLDWGILENAVGPRVRLLRNALGARSIAASAPHGLPTGSLTVLALVAANPGSSQAALAAKAGINKSALVGLVDELETRGLIARDRSASDRRRNDLTVTPEGTRAMQALFEAVIPAEGRIRDALDTRDLTVLLALLDRAIGALES